MSASLVLTATFVALLLASAFFSGSEVALFSLRRWRVERYRLEKRGSAPLVAKLLRDPRRLLVTILIGNETVNICLANVGSELRHGAEVMVSPALRPWLAPAAALVTALLLVLFGEVVPKNIAIAMPERWALLASRPLALLSRLTAVPQALLAKVLVVFGGKASEVAMTTEDFLGLVSEGERAGALSSRERELIQSVFEFRETTVRAIMTPRSDMQSLPVTATLDDAIRFVRQHKYSRVPVFDPESEDSDEIVGVVYVNDLLAHRYGLRTVDGLGRLMRPPLFVPETKKAKDLLREFQERSVQMAVVLDEYGGTVGIVTLDDLLSEVVGEIADSFDTAVAFFDELAPGVFRVLARMPLQDFADRLGVAIEAPGCHTLGGYVLTLFGRVPVRGAVTETDRFSFTVLSMAGKQLVTLLVRDKTRPPGREAR